jgi:hypothetical protein
MCAEWNYAEIQGEQMIVGESGAFGKVIESKINY